MLALSTIKKSPGCRLWAAIAALKKLIKSFSVFESRGDW